MVPAATYRVSSLCAALVAATALAGSALAGDRGATADELAVALARAEQRARAVCACQAASDAHSSDEFDLSRLTWQRTAEAIDPALRQLGLVARASKVNMPAHWQTIGPLPPLEHLVPSGGIARPLMLQAAPGVPGAVRDKHVEPAGYRLDVLGAAIMLDYPGSRTASMPAFRPTGWGVFTGVENHPPSFTNILYDCSLSLVIGPNRSGGNTSQVAGGNIVLYGDPASESVGIGWQRRSR